MFFKSEYFLKIFSKKYRLISESVFFKNKPWQRAIFPSGLPLSIVTASSLYGRVRDGNGCFPAALSPEINLLCALHTGNCIIELSRLNQLRIFKLHSIVRRSPRPISTDRLHMLPRFYLRPINQIFCLGSY